MTFINRIADATIVKFMHEALNNVILHCSHSLDIFIGKFSGTFFEKSNRGIT